MNIFEEDCKAINDLLQSKNDSMANLGDCIQRLLDLQKDIEVAESLLKNKKAELYKIESEILPDLMMSLNCKTYVTNSGEVISLKDVVNGNIPSLTAIARAKGDKREDYINRRNAAFEWLKQQGLDGVIKNEININVGKDKEGRDKILSALKGIGIDANINENVHASTLNALFKDLLRSGEEIPQDVFNLHVGKVVKVKKVS